MKKTLILIQFIFIAIMTISSMSCVRKIDDTYKMLVKAGQFTDAKKAINEVLRQSNDLSESDRKELQFEFERMDRIEKDFNQSDSAVLSYIRKFIPDVRSEDLEQWEVEKSLEYIMIDGEKRYFENAARNLFRLDSECRKIWQEAHKISQISKSFDLDGHIAKVIQEGLVNDQKYFYPVRIRFRYSIEVDENAVPAGETIRCWIPFPREIPQRQETIKLINSDPEKYIIAPNDSFLQRTIYFEKPSQGSQKTTFSVEYEYTAYAVYLPIDSNKVVPVISTEELTPFLKEEPPHIVFTPELRALSDKIVGEEKNPFLIAKRLYAWIDLNIPWASAREYSTIRNISQYCYANMHGDCGIKAMLYITLLRLKGIPARWQSGWRFKPPSQSMHDWGMVYFEPYGWLPMDVDYGLRKSDDDRLKWFYLGGMDSYRLIFNDAYSQEFYPQKNHFRSETIDSQRGELEWKGGNLYFDQWSWNMKFEVIH
jgi:transglutaminase-like putative cysteine protease